MSKITTIICLITAIVLMSAKVGDGRALNDDDDELVNDEVIPVVHESPINNNDDSPFRRDDGSGDDANEEKPPPVASEDAAEAPSKMTGDDDDNIIINSTPPPTMTTTTVKDLKGRQLTRLSAGDFDQSDKLDNIRELIADENYIDSIEKEIFNNMPNLERVSLNNNRISSLDMETFSEASKLFELNLDKNPLELPSVSHFLTIPSLRKLSMSECGLKEIPEITFDGMAGLEELNIGKNPIDENKPITKGLFEPLSNLSKLILPKGTSDELIEDVCKTHSLLQSICLDECSVDGDKLCSHAEPAESVAPEDEIVPLQETPMFRSSVPKDEAVPNQNGQDAASKTDADENIKRVNGIVPILAEQDAPSRPEADENIQRVNEIGQDAPATSKPGANENLPILDGKDVLASSKSGVSNQGTNGAAIGILIAVIAVIVIAVVLKKNWNKIKRRMGGSSGSRNGPTPAPRQNQDVVAKPPEEMPLKMNNAQDDN